MISVAECPGNPNSSIISKPFADLSKGACGTRKICTIRPKASQKDALTFQEKLAILQKTATMGWTQKQTVSHLLDPCYGAVMFSSLPPMAHDHQPFWMIFENLQRLSFQTKHEFEQYLKDYTAAQAWNRGGGGDTQLREKKNARPGMQRSLRHASEEME